MLKEVAHEQPLQPSGYYPTWEDKAKAWLAQLTYHFPKLEEHAHGQPPKLTGDSAECGKEAMEQLSHVISKIL